MLQAKVVNTTNCEISNQGYKGQFLDILQQIMQQRKCQRAIIGPIGKEVVNMYKTQVESEYPLNRDWRSQFCGFPKMQRNSETLSIQLETDSRLCILNSYRKIMMAFYPVYKFKVQVFQTDDRFLIPDFIEKRIQQVPLNLFKFQYEDIEQLNFKLQVTNKLQEPMIVYTDHVFQESNKERTSITSGLQIADSYNLFKLQEGCSISIELGLLKQLPESDDKYRGCFISIFEDEDEQNIDNDNYVSERSKSKILIKTYGSMNRYEFAQFFATQYIEKLVNSDILIRVDKLQTTIVFNNIPIFIVDAVLCLNKDYFYKYFQSVMPTTTNDYQSCLILVPKQNERKQTQEELQQQIQNTIQNFIHLMQKLEEQIIQTL